MEAYCSFDFNDGFRAIAKGEACTDERKVGGRAYRGSGCRRYVLNMNRISPQGHIIAKRETDSGCRNILTAVRKRAPVKRVSCTRVNGVIGDGIRMHLE